MPDMTHLEPSPYDRGRAMPLTDDELDCLHDETVARFPGGLTPEQYRHVVLESADEDGRVYPHTISNWWHQQSLLMGMFMKGLIKTNNRYNEPMKWSITEAGRTALAERSADE